MTTQPEALRLADAIDPFVRPYAPDHLTSKVAAAELRRLHAENASLAAALASSCDEQRHQLWESGGIAGCDRARVAERQRDALLLECIDIVALHGGSVEIEAAIRAKMGEANEQDYD